MTLSAIMAIKKYLEADPNGRTTATSDLAGLKKASSPEEWAQFAKDAAAALGEELA